MSDLGFTVIKSLQSPHLNTGGVSLYKSLIQSLTTSILIQAKQTRSFYHFGKKFLKKSNLLVTVLFVAVRAVKVLTSQRKICLSNPPEATISLLLA